MQRTVTRFRSPLGHALATLAILSTSSTADATTTSDLCTGDPCTISRSQTVDPGSVLDFGDAALVIAENVIVTVGPAIGGSNTELRNLAIRAASIRFDPRGKISGNGEGIALSLSATTGNISLLSSGTSRSEIDATGVLESLVRLNAEGDVILGGRVTSRGTAEFGSGGQLEVIAKGTISVTETIDVSATGPEGLGGYIALDAGGDVSIGAALMADGTGFGGGELLLISATGNISITQAIDLDGGNPEGSGGMVEIRAPAGDVSITGQIRGVGGAGADACGDGAEARIHAGGTVTFGSALQFPGGIGCGGGSVDVVVDEDVVMSAGGALNLRGQGMFADGGRVTMSIGRNVTLGAIDISGGGFAGTLNVNVGGATTIAGSIDARTPFAEGSAGEIQITACTLNIGTAAVLEATGGFDSPGSGTGSIRLTAGGAMAVAGKLRAESEVKLFWKAQPPLITGQITPTPTIEQDLTLRDCVFASACGDASLDPGEICDDGNLLSCDGCAADCSRPDAVCGDGLQECGEPCDDGNLSAGDACTPGCELPEESEVARFSGNHDASACLMQWVVDFADPVGNPRNGRPDSSQSCIDGDPGCDQDAAVNHSCTFVIRSCLRTSDPAIPSCSANAIEYVKIKKPLPGRGNDPIDLTNADRLSDALIALGGTVKAGVSTLQSGAPIAETDTCTERFDFVVPILAANGGRRSLSASARDSEGKLLTRNKLELICARNSAICGNGALEIGEACDDGNRAACDGCTGGTCQVEACGNEIVECDEQCDDGTANGQATNRCNASCSLLPPLLRIPGGGPRSLDCPFEWSMEAQTARVATGNSGVPKFLQHCTDGDSGCDFDPASDRCLLRLWACAGAADARLACAAQEVASIEVQNPSARSRNPSDRAARTALARALNALTLPAGPGESCTSMFEIALARDARVTLGILARPTTGRGRDIDKLKLYCD